MIDVYKMAQAASGYAQTAERLGGGVVPPRPSFVPPPPRDPTPDLIAASLAAGMSAAGGKVVSAEEAVEVWRRVREALMLPSKSNFNRNQ